MNRLKVFGLSVLFGLVAIALTVMGFFIAMLAVFIIPVIAIFTGLWFIWAVKREHDDESKD